MKPITVAWIEYAERDFDDAEALIKAKRYHGALYFLEQSVEKLIKAYILEYVKSQVPFVHDIRYLLEMTGISIREIRNIDLKGLSLVYTRIRYPDMNTKYFSDQKEVERLVTQFNLLYKWLLKQFKNK